MVKFSVILPVHNESGNLRKLNAEIRSVMRKMGSYQMIYVNDGSTDESLKTLKSLNNCTIIDLQRNYGQSAAMDAGFKHASGDYVISMDSDIQNDPNDIPKMFEHMRKNNLDVVAGWRVKRRDPLHIRILTKIARFLRGFLIKDNIHDIGCTLRIYTKQAAKSLDLWGQMHRYIIPLLEWKGFSVGEIKTNHRKRHSGSTHYGFVKSVNGLTDLIYIWFINKYSRRPLHLFGAMSFFMFFVGLVMEIIAIYMKIVYSISLNREALFYAGFFFMIISVQLFVSGVIIDILLRSYFNTSPVEGRYRIKDIITR